MVCSGVQYRWLDCKQKVVQRVKKTDEFVIENQ